MLATCPTPTASVQARRSGRPTSSPTVARSPVRFTRSELVLMLREYRADPSLTPEQRREAVAWITGHQADRV